MDREILDTIFNNEETSPKTMLKKFRELKYQLQDYVVKNAVQGPEGPQGERGPQGPQGPKGEKGDEGLSIYTTSSYLPIPTGSISKATIDIPSDRTLKVGDLILSKHESSNGYIHRITQFTGNNVVCVNIGNIRGPEGPQGPQGEPGTGIHIKGTADAGTIDMDVIGSEGTILVDGEVVVGSEGDCYLIDGNLVVYVGPSLWKNVGVIRGPQGPEGPEGPQGPKGEKGDDANLDDYYTKTEIDTMIGDIETLLGGI